MYKKVINQQRKFDREERKEINNLMEEKNKDLAMTLVKKHLSGAKIENSPTEGGSNGKTYEETIKSNKSIQIIEGKLVNSIKNIDNSDSSQLSFHESSIDEEQLYNETRKYLKNDRGFRNLMSKYLNKRNN